MKGMMEERFCESSEQGYTTGLWAQRKTPRSVIPSNI